MHPETNEPRPVSSLEAFDVDPVKAVALNGKAAKIRKLQTIDVLRFAATADLGLARLGFTRADIAVKDLDADKAARLVQKLVGSCASDFDLETDSVKPGSISELILTTIGKLFQVEAADVLRADVDELYSAVVALWEANMTGPFGQAAKNTIAAWKTQMAPKFAVLTDLVMINLESVVMRARLAGGMPNGGLIGSSGPSTTHTDGENQTSYGFPSPESSQTSEALPTANGTAPPSSGAFEAIDPAELADLVTAPTGTASSEATATAT